MSGSNVITSFSEALEKRRLRDQQIPLFRSKEDRDAFVRTLRRLTRPKQGLQDGEKKLTVPREVRLARERGNKRALVAWMIQEGQL